MTRLCAHEPTRMSGRVPTVGFGICTPSQSERVLSMEQKMPEIRTSRRGFHLFLASLLIATASMATAADQTQPEKKTVRLLTIGNSFSRNATRYLPQLTEAGGHQLIHHPIVVGGASMQLHADKAAQHAADPDSLDGKYNDKTSLVQRLKQEPWDVVTIQQASRLSPHVESYRPYASQLKEIIQANAPQAQLFIHETWAYRDDDPWFTKPAKGSGNPLTRDEMHRKLQAAYRTIAAELGAGLIPVGDAFQLVAEDSKWGYRPDQMFHFKEAIPPALPDQKNSLHVGWQWKKENDKAVLKIDAHHANVAGEFLGSCVFYEVLFGCDVSKNPFSPQGLDPEFAAFLKQTAHRAVSDLKTASK